MYGRRRRAVRLLDHRAPGTAGSVGAYSASVTSRGSNILGRRFRHAWGCDLRDDGLGAQCPSCSYRSKNAGYFVNHVRAAHGLSYQDAITTFRRETGESWVECPYCGYLALNEKGVTSHAVRMHGVTAADVAAHYGRTTAFARLPNVPGVYAIRHPGTARIYIGQSVDMGKRVYQHLRDLEAHTHENPLLLLDYLLMEEGQEFEFSVLKECPDDELSYCEIVLIQEHHAIGEGYNLAKVGQRGSSGQVAREMAQASRKIEEILGSPTDEDEWR